jgi:2-oxoglutarate/2-oxoacid ferredoxin oxidoreductase subunit beta
MSTYTREDFANTVDIRWCPGCGDYAILAAIQRVLPELGLPPEKHVFISGIGCAGRLPYYMNTYGFHTIHGRALGVATGLAALRDDVTVWVITGDGDALSIGGNHFIHCLRRNVNVNILLLNNQVYGLTKGQFSPTSQKGQITKTSPDGVEHEPLNPIRLALASGASFVARAVDKDPQHLGSILKQAHAHKGCSFVEIYQDCHIFNSGAFDDFSLKNQRAQRTVMVQDQHPLIYGQDQEHALIYQNGNWIKSNADQAMPYDSSNWQAAMSLATLQDPELPVPLGVYYQHDRAAFKLNGNLNKSLSDLPNLYRSRASWKQ